MSILDRCPVLDEDEVKSKGLLYSMHQLHVFILELSILDEDEVND